MQWLLYILVGLVLFMAWTQLLAWRRAVQAQGQLAPDTSGIDGHANLDTRRVYYFYAAQCGACRVMAPTVDFMRARHRNLIKVDVAALPELAHAFHIAVTPSFVLVENGVIRQVKRGALSDQQLLTMLQTPLRGRNT